ncbi:hypothetical protein IFM89_037272 [Coptis chinensis]|uniref:Uncharacterized protein n=1 Tax=Coptis chinensis TaxID=261450 RepID=A0A835I7U9_9MAGN|nr:hypothetical protein IFM89_037272 [Coptis chinensis]
MHTPSECQLFLRNQRLFLVLMLLSPSIVAVVASMDWPEISTYKDQNIDITDSCSQMMLHLHDFYDPKKINIKIEIVSGTPCGAVDVEAKLAQANWVVLDKWELGACWVQHLQNHAPEKTDAKKTEEAKVDPTVKGLGKHGDLLKEIKKKTDEKSLNAEQGRDNVSTNGPNPRGKLESIDDKELEKKELEKEMMLRKLLPEAALLRVKDSGTGFHLKVCTVATLNSRLSDLSDEIVGGS